MMRSLRIRLIDFVRCLAFTLAASGVDVSPVRADDPRRVRVSDAIVTLSEQIEVPARSAGALATLRVREGDVVKSGQLAGAIDDIDARLAASKAETALASAKAEAANDLKVLAAESAAAAAKAELQRALESSEKYAKSVSKSELDRLRLQVDKGMFEHRQAEHERRQAELAVRIKQNELDSARRALELHGIIAPSEGVVVEVRRHVGEWVEPGVPVLRIVRMNPIRVEGFLSATDALAVRSGCEVSFHSTTGEESGGRIVGKLSFVSPEIDPVNGQVRVWAEFPNHDGSLRPGLQGTLELPAADFRQLRDGQR